MQNNPSFNYSAILKKYWFQLALVSIVLYVVISKDLSFQFNVNNPDIENTKENHYNSKDKSKKSTELMTQNNSNPTIAKSEAGFFSNIPFIGSGSSSTKKSELPQIDPAVVESYLKRFAHVAINERRKYGVPSSIILANSLFHSYAGRRNIAQTGNNHFGIPCSTDWAGPSGSYEGMCYRHYENAWTSFRDHSLYVTSGKFAKLRELGPTDYKSWAKNLESGGFSEFEDLEKNLIDLIEKYGLDQLDVK